MQITDLRNPVHKVISRPQNSFYQFVRFVDADDETAPLDLSAYNMFLTVRNGNFTNTEFLVPIEQNWAKEIKLKRVAKDSEGNPMQPIESGIYLNFNTAVDGQPTGRDFKLIINQFPSTLIPVGTYVMDWVIQYINGQTDVLFTIIWEVTDTLPESTIVEQSPFIKLPVSFVIPTPIQIGIKMIQTPL